VIYRGYGLQSAVPASLRINGKQAQVNLPSGHAAAKLTVTLPGGKGARQIVVPAGVTQLAL
jgi:hypothetical protein